mgnify:CR=1 FL=1|jgi:hypothetical protein
MNSKKERVTISLHKAKPSVISLIESETKRHKGNISKAFIGIAESKLALEMAIITLEGKVKELENNGFENKVTSLNGGQALSEPTTENAFDYENWYSDCEYGTYFKDKKQVHCRCTYPSVSKWLPRNRMVDPQVCDNCFPRIQGIKDFVETQREERNALAHTKGYFTNEHGTRIPY